MRKFWDERGHLVTENEIREEYNGLIQSGKIDDDHITFKQWLKNCQSSAGGTLTEIKTSGEVGNMETIFNGFTVKDNHAKQKKSGWSKFSAEAEQHHIITVKHGDKLTRFDFWASRVHPTIDNAKELLGAFYCFVSDAIAGADDFGDFCREFGYEDAGEAYKIWKACQHAKEKMTRIYSGDIYDLVNSLSAFS